mmetsp:Transcript_27971/g.86512  ORF Transcript_27971/g.86512 Transcript_27971/m.86512 type:complete len:420 (+) Transcript_27971:26-1285(+)
MLGLGTAAITLLFGRLLLGRLRASTDDRPPLMRQKAYRHLPGLPPRDAPPPYELAYGGAQKCAGGMPPKPEDDCGASAPGFALKLLAELAADRENCFASPLSLATALKMVEAGATDGSKHQAALRAAVGAFDVSVEGVDAANAIYARASIKPAFTETLHERFGATAAAMPATAAPVNKWVSDKTRGLIDKLVEDGTVQDPLVKALLLNAIYFKGSWATPFDEKKSKEGPFAAPGRKVTATFMSSKGRVVASRQRGVGAAVALPYSEHGLRMVLALPEAEGLEGARDLAAALPAQWAALRPGDDEEMLDLRVPRFKIDSGVVDVLELLCSKFDLAVIRDEDDGFLKMSDARDLHVGAVLHRAVVEVNEEGTVAAAATAAVMTDSCAGASMFFDRPFVFLIEHEPTGRVLFAGVVADPTSG